MSKQRSTLWKGRNFNAKFIRHCCRFCQQSRTLLRHRCWCGPGLSSPKPGPHQQQCRPNIVECYKSNDSFDKVERCFDIVAVGNNVQRKFFLSSKSKQTEHVQFVSTLSKGQNFTKNSFNVLAVLETKSKVASTLLTRGFSEISSEASCSRNRFGTIFKDL